MTRRRPLRGVSLLETMVAMLLISTLLLLSLGWVHQSFKFSSLMQQRQSQHQTLLRLARQVRDDLRHGHSVTVDQNNRVLVQLPADQQVAYQTIDQQLVRRSRSAADPPTEDAFPLASGTTVQWDASELPDWISLTIRRAESLPELHLRVSVNRFGDSAIASDPTTESDPTEVQQP